MSVNITCVYLDADKYGHKEDGDGEEEEKHEEPGAPVQPVTETHHAHVLLQSTHTHTLQSSLLTSRATGSMSIFVYLQFPLLLLHHSADDIQRGVGEAEHQQQRQLVLDGQDEDVVDERWVREAGQQHLGSLEEGRRCCAVVGLHDGPVHRMLHLQEALTVISCPETRTVTHEIHSIKLMGFNSIKQTEENILGSVQVQAQIDSFCGLMLDTTYINFHLSCLFFKRVKIWVTVRLMQCKWMRPICTSLFR